MFARAGDAIKAPLRKRNPDSVQFPRRELHPLKSSAFPGALSSAYGVPFRGRSMPYARSLPSATAKNVTIVTRASALLTGGANQVANIFDIVSGDAYRTSVRPCLLRIEHETVERLMPIAIQTAGYRFNHAMTNRGAVDSHRFLGPNHIIDPIESGVTHGSDKSGRNAKQFPLLAPLVPDVDPNTAPRVQRNRFEYIDKIADVLSHGRFSS